MRVDYRKKGFVLFNRNLNVLGNAEQTRLEELPLERFNVEEIPLKGEVVGTRGIYRCILLYRSDQSLCRICTEFAKA